MHLRRTPIELSNCVCILARKCLFDDVGCCCCYYYLSIVAIVVVACLPLLLSLVEYLCQRCLLVKSHSITIFCRFRLPQAKIKNFTRRTLSLHIHLFLLNFCLLEIID